MARPTLTGSRIRERRALRGMRQAELARRAGISASYLNLIEHNRRRIGGKLLLDIAAALDVEPSLLSEGAEAALIATLREAAADRAEAGAEADAVEELAGRFPGWAALVAAQHRAIEGLERTLEVLTDRLTHDPHLAASMHEVLSTVTAIHSTASILVETKEIEPEWRDRFHRNINEDSQRLAEGAQRLVSELEAGQRRQDTLGAPQDEVERFLAARGFHLPELEAGGGATPAEVIAEAGEALSSTAAREMAQGILARYAEDAARLAVGPVTEAAAETLDPGWLAARFGVGPGAMMRRLASLPPEAAATLGGPFGLVACDASGTFTFRRPLPGFPLPRFGAACPLWPLFQALSRPMIPLRQRLRLASRAEGWFVTHAVAEPVGVVQAGREPLFEAHMLIVPDRDESEEGLRRVGVTCRICPRAECRGRREPSIMAESAAAG
ncbi:helix-turn-helix domain-containing protein [Pseudooceanicola nanhaiensis]|jgi:transcriptional regulator with XRE-family HTH domain|uniref:XRE family transcriptional regulator n=1 Tax=Pseudooceanicola nanhaiensis TaxID=375761 RepID=A0A917SLW8_9RHOB|nr:helix-turn-helix transcriptional regulator [Pseudooceanicola nanhaiensis]GGL86211.1 XRE family transcriptional regulator [Pseudooceanicola nanhaiensis]